MGGRSWCGGIAVAIAMIAAVTVLTACGAVPGTQTPLPTFPPPSATSAPGAGKGPDDKGVIPDDCARVLSTDVLEAVLGLPLGSVKVHTTLHLPAPAVGRTERIACRYTRTDAAKDRPVLLLDVGAYRDVDAAMAQWRVNIDAEDTKGRDLTLGSARAVLVERSEESLLMVVNALANFYFVLPRDASLADRPVEDTLVDLALRTLPAVSAAVSPPAHG